MAASKVVILTGASRGMGLTMAKYLLEKSHNVVATARSLEALQDLQSQYTHQLEICSADLSDLSAGQKIIDIALKRFSKIDGIIVNHGTLGAVKRVGDSTAEEWRSTFDVNFFSTVSLIQAALPSLRLSSGRIILVSSGAAVSTYSTWGPYGASKAAMNHLALTLAAEEPQVTTMAIRPGVVDTAMQQGIRDIHAQNMDSKDAEKFNGLHRDGKLLKPEQPGHVMARLAIGAGPDLCGKFIRVKEMVY